MKRGVAAGLGLTAIAFVTTRAVAYPVDDIIYDNGSPDYLMSVVSDFDLPDQNADDFVLSAGANVITGVHFWGPYGTANTPDQPDDFTIRIYADAGGLPAANPLHSFSVGDLGRTDTGEDTNFDVYEYSAVIPNTALLPGVSYWLSIVNNTAADTDDDWYWARSSFLGNRASRDTDADPWSPGGVPIELAFHLTGVPEPSSALLLAVGSFLLAARRRRRA